MVIGSSDVRAPVDDAMWRLASSMVVTIFELTMQGPLFPRSEDAAERGRSCLSVDAAAPPDGSRREEWEERVSGDGVGGGGGASGSTGSTGSMEVEEGGASEVEEENGSHEVERSEEGVGTSGVGTSGGGGAQPERVSLQATFAEAGDASLQWELACYALLLVIHTPSLAVGTSRTRDAMLSDVQLPVGRLLAGATPGLRASAKRTVVGQESFGLVLQVLRQLAEQGPFRWSLRDVSFSPADLYLYFEQSKAKTRKAYLFKGKQPRYSAHLEAAKQLLLDHDQGRLLIDVVSVVEARLVSAHGERWHESWDRLHDDDAFVSDATAASGVADQPARAGRPSDALLQALQRSAPKRLLEELRELRGANEALEAGMAELEASAVPPPGVLDPALLHQTATNLLRELDAHVEAGDATALFAGGDLEGLDKDQLATLKRATRLWHLKSQVLDAALNSQPELHRMLVESMQRSDPSKGRDELDAKVRCCFVLLNFIARTRWRKGAAESILAWGMGIFLIANHSPPIAIEGLRDALPSCVVSHRELWAFLRNLAELIELSYSTWFPGQRLVLASDNWQTERSWGRGRIGQYAPQTIEPIARSHHPGARGMRWSARQAAAMLHDDPCANQPYILSSATDCCYTLTLVASAHW